MYGENSSSSSRGGLSEGVVNIGISSENRAAVNEVLSRALADLHVLYVKTRNCHWNLVGRRFHSLHEFFEEQYTQLAEAIDEVAERIRMLGGVSPASMEEFLRLARLKEKSGALIEGDEALGLLEEDHEAIARQLRHEIPRVEEELKDVGTADFLTGQLRNHEQAAWMLRSFLERP